MNLIIREAREEDADDLLSYRKQIHQGDAQFLLPLHPGYTPEVQAEDIKHFTATKNAFLLNGYIDNTLVAAIDFIPHSSFFKLHIGRLGISVKKEHRAKGYARQMMAHLIQVLQHTEITKIESEIFSANTACIKLHTNLGFVQEGTISKALFYNNQFIDIVNMALFTNKGN